MDWLKLAIPVSMVLFVVGGTATIEAITSSRASPTVVNLHSIFVGGFGALTIVFILALVMRTLVRKMLSLVRRRRSPAAPVSP